MKKKIPIFVHFDCGDWESGDTGIPCICSRPRFPVIRGTKGTLTGNKKIETKIIPIEKCPINRIAGGKFRVQVYPTKAQALACMDGLIMLDPDDRNHVDLARKTPHGWAVLAFDWEGVRVEGERIAGDVMIQHARTSESWDVEAADATEDDD